MGDGRDETEMEGLDRNLDELLQGLRVALPGVQVLFAFLLVVPFNQGYARMSAFDPRIYFAILMCTALATILLITNLLFGTRATVAATAATLAVFAGVWYGLPLHRRERLDR